MTAHISLYDLLQDSAQHHGDRRAFAQGAKMATYSQLLQDVRLTAERLADSGVQAGERVAVYAGKQYETVVMLLAINAHGAILVPINPQLKEQQVRHILLDSGTRLLLSTGPRLRRIEAALKDIHLATWQLEKMQFADLNTPANTALVNAVTDSDPAAILYTSGSTGQPKGVVLSQRNLVSGAYSVAHYLRLRADDVILGILPLSFDAGLSQLTTALASGACYAPLDFLQAAEVPTFCEAHGVTAITGVPPLWMQLASVQWPVPTGERIRCFTNTGGHMPTPLLEKLRSAFPDALPYLMYGLTEAFRSTYLPPDAVVTRPESIGKAVPNADIRVMRQDGSECAVGEHGELVHRGAFVTLGYWNDPELTAQRYRPWARPGQQISRDETEVWSGDIVYRDRDDYLYFVARSDDMIKTSGYRVSPTEVEEILFAADEVTEAAAFGVPHPQQGEAIIISVFSQPQKQASAEALIKLCREKLPTYMVPLHVSFHDSPLPRNPNGKIDRKQLKQQFSEFFSTPLTVTE
ncbi:acyl-CoA ligase (AMP-forming), exosortase A system-associated [Pseudomonas arsenicoxydans]|uniref:Acyl-CoA ligase (AMP-forming), exosortase A system-associated n=1 Tax=Pseudomonas arsenicoxydans TaxID=702115 RepID=A0A502GUW6_9PSED|nr:acyl-CoA ligase (AMP-forming), exosortase A system-associated [Pseudomonas arsenicoxydans]TPG65674.1 acyl-CoA ligase (AMP-forming), exosortase A system-associated [Pseudomonas arsenicoxydans]